MAATLPVTIAWSTGDRGSRPRESEPATLQAAAMTPAWDGLSVDHRSSQPGRSARRRCRTVIPGAAVGEAMAAA